jgi:hypothetical protein
VAEMDFWSGITFADTHGAAALLQPFYNLTIQSLTKSASLYTHYKKFQTLVARQGYLELLYQKEARRRIRRY